MLALSGDGKARARAGVMVERRRRREIRLHQKFKLLQLKHFCQIEYFILSWNISHFSKSKHLKAYWAVLTQSLLKLTVSDRFDWFKVWTCCCYTSLIKTVEGFSYTNQHSMICMIQIYSDFSKTCKWELWGQRRQ